MRNVSTTRMESVQGGIEGCSAKLDRKRDGSHKQQCRKSVDRAGVHPAGSGYEERRMMRRLLPPQRMHPHPQPRLEVDDYLCILVPVSSSRFKD